MAMAILVPYLVVADEGGYSFTDIDIPISPIYDDGAETRYTENLWEVTDEAVYDEEGFQVDEFEESEEESAVSPDTEITPKIPEDADSFEEYKKSLISSWGGKKSFAEKLEGFWVKFHISCILVFCSPLFYFILIFNNEI